MKCIDSADKSKKIKKISLLYTYKIPHGRKDMGPSMGEKQKVFIDYLADIFIPNHMNDKIILEYRKYYCCYF